MTIEQDCQVLRLWLTQEGLRKQLLGSRFGLDAQEARQAVLRQLRRLCALLPHEEAVQVYKERRNHVQTCRQYRAYWLEQLQRFEINHYLTLSVEQTPTPKEI